MPEFGWSFYEELNKNCKNCKFKKGDEVVYIGNEKKYEGKTFRVLAGSRVNEELTEYLLYGFPYLVWEDEIKKEETYDLPEILASIFLSDDDDIGDLNIDDFYDFVGIEKKYRTDFATVAMVEQANTLYENAR